MKEKAKKKVLQELRDRMRKKGSEGMLSGGIGVAVKAKDKEGLLEGLKKAKEIVKKEELPEEDEYEESEDSPCEMSQDDIRAKIAELESKLED